MTANRRRNDNTHGFNDMVDLYPTTVEQRAPCRGVEPVSGSTPQRLEFDLQGGRTGLGGCAGRSLFIQAALGVFEVA